MATISPLFIAAAHHAVLPERRDASKPRDRFIEYQEDLHRIAGQQLDPASLYDGDQYTYVKLADHLLDEVATTLLPDLDVLVTTYWTPEFDPDISAFGPYLHHRWSMACQSFDVIDQGSISPVLALLVLREYLLADPDATAGVLVGVEQSTVPQAVGAHFPGPQRSSAGAVRLSRRPVAGGPEILAVHALPEARVVDPAFDARQLLADWCGHFRIEPGNLTVGLRRNTYLYRRWFRDDGVQAVAYGTRFLPPEHSCMNLFRWLSDLSSEEPTDDRYVALLDEDVESLAAAAVLVRQRPN